MSYIPIVQKYFRDSFVVIDMALILPGMIHAITFPCYLTKTCHFIRRFKLFFHLLRNGRWLIATIFHEWTFVSLRNVLCCVETFLLVALLVAKINLKKHLSKSSQTATLNGFRFEELSTRKWNYLLGKLKWKLRIVWRWWFQALVEFS